MKKSILITGGSGFIGRHLLNKIRAFSIDKIEGGAIENAEKIIKEINPNIIIHLASHSTVKEVEEDPIGAANSIINNVINLLQWCKNTTQFIYFSSSMVYGDFTDGIKEDALCSPKNMYGLMKKTAEDFVKLRANNYTIIRPSAVYGPNDKPQRVIPTFFKQALRGDTLKVNGNNSADFTYIDDIVAGTLKVINNEKAYNQTYNITYGHSHTLEYLANAIVELCNSSSSIEIVKPDKIYPKRGSLNIDKIKELGYYPEYNLERGLKKTYELFWTQKTI